MSEQRSVEGKLQRLAGQSPEKRQAVAQANEEYLWRAKCWHCGTYNEALRQNLKTCNACGVNLWSRDEKSSE